jgi:lipoate-protein ligase A
VPDEKFRDKVHKTLVDNLSTVRRELGGERAGKWTEEQLNGLLAGAFAEILGPLEAAEVDPELRAKADALRALMLGDAWLYQRGSRALGAGVKIRAGVHVRRNVHKAPGGLIRADFEVREGVYAAVSISGDFFCYPSAAIPRLEAALEGRKTAEVRAVLAGFAAANRFEAPGVGIEDWACALKA